MALSKAGGFSLVRRALRHNTRAESPSITVSPGQLDDNQVFYVNATQGVMQISQVSIWLEATDAGETVTLYNTDSGTAIEDGSAVLSNTTFSLASGDNALDTHHTPTLSTTKGALWLKPGNALGIVLSGTDTTNFVLTVDLIPA